MQTGLLVLGGWMAGEAFAANAASQPPVILVLGDSLSAEYGIARGSGWVALLTLRLSAGQWPHRVVNASISGETTSGGLSRLPRLLAEHKPTLVVVELGANDALRGFPLAVTENNLAAITKASRTAGAQVVLVPMQIPPNYGAAYSKEFNALYARVSKAHQAKVTPFMFEGLADDPDPRRWFQPDGLHPLASAQPHMLDNLWPTLKAVIGSK